MSLHLWTPFHEEHHPCLGDKGQESRARDRARAVTVAPRQVADTIAFFYLHRRLLISSSPSSSTTSSTSSSSSLRFLHLAPALKRALGTRASPGTSQGLRAVKRKIAVAAAAVAASDSAKGQGQGQDKSPHDDPLSTLRRTVEILALDVLGYEGWDNDQEQGTDHSHDLQTTPLSLSEPLSFFQPLVLFQPLSLCRTRSSMMVQHRVTVSVYLAVLRGLVGVFTDEVGQREGQGQEEEEEEEWKGQGQGKGSEESNDVQEQPLDRPAPAQGPGLGPAQGPGLGPAPGLGPVSEVALALGLSSRPHAPVGQVLLTPPTAPAQGLGQQGLGQQTQTQSFSTPTGSGSGSGISESSSSGQSLITHTPSISPALRTAVRPNTRTYMPLHCHCRMSHEHIKYTIPYRPLHCLPLHHLPLTQSLLSHHSSATTVESYPLR